MAAKRTSTIGYEKKYNPALQSRSREEFIESLTADMPAVPDHFGRCSEANRKGPPSIADLPAPERLDPRSFRHLSEREDHLVLDVRGYGSFGGQHIPGAYHDDLSGNFATFAGWILPAKANLLLVADRVGEVEEAATWLRRVGLDQVVGYLEGSMPSWAVAGLPTDHIGQLSAHELYATATGADRMVLVDVRSPSEYESLHIRGALNIPVPDLRTRYEELARDVRTVLICSTGRRSSLGASLLKQRGFKDVFNAAGGMRGYSASGYAAECPVCHIPHGPRFLGQRTATRSRPM